MFICINKNPDGSHSYQIGGPMEDGWAVVPDGMDLPDSFPFVNIETALVTHPAVTETRENGDVIVIIPEYTQMEVVSMTEGKEIPVDTPEYDTGDITGTVYDDMAQAYREGVQSA